MRAFSKITFGAALAIASFTSLTSTTIAHAQSNPALAESLFVEGQKLLEAGRTHEACDRLAASERIDPALGTLINLALCHERDGKTATAWGEYVDAAAQASKTGERDRERFAREHATALEAAIPKVRIVIADPHGNEQVTIDSVAIPASALGAEIPVDPGDHAIDVTAPAKKRWTQAKVTVPPGPASLRIDVTLEDAEAKEAATPVSIDTTRRTIGLIVGGAGIAALGVGIAMLARASAFDSKSRDEATKANLFVPADATFKAASLSDHSSAQTSQTIGLVAGGIGVAAIGTGLYLVLTANHEERANDAARLRFVPHILPSGGRANAGLDVDFRF